MARRRRSGRRRGRAKAIRRGGFARGFALVPAGALRWGIGGAAGIVASNLLGTKLIAQLADPKSNPKLSEFLLSPTGGLTVALGVGIASAMVMKRVKPLRPYAAPFVAGIIADQAGAWLLDKIREGMSGVRGLGMIAPPQLAPGEASAMLPGQTLEPAYQPAQQYQYGG